MLIAKEKDPAAFIEFGRAGGRRLRLRLGDSALAGGAPLARSTGCSCVCASCGLDAVKGELLEACEDFSDLEVGPDRRLYLLSDKSQSIARSGGASRGRPRRRGLTRSGNSRRWTANLKELALTRNGE